LNPTYYTINRQSPIALYYQLKRILVAQIEDGIYQVGDRLPSEYELTQKYQVSRQVVRQALKEMIHEGRIVVQQGSGYFVNQPRIREKLPRLISHTESMAKLGRATQTLVMRQEIATPPDAIAHRLLPAGENQAVLLERVTYLDNRPVSMITSYYLLKYREPLLMTDLNNRSVYAHLRQACSIVPKSADVIISVTFADENQSTLLGIHESMPLLNVAGFTVAESGEVFEYASVLYRIDRFELELELIKQQQEPDS